MTQSSALNRLLLLASTFEKRRVGDLKTGAHIFGSHGWSIQDITDEVTKDRMRLSSYCLTTARQGFRARKFRLSAARAYYSFYHSARSVVYFTHGGDDHQAHSDLPKHLPHDFPSRDTWRNELNAARLRRNEADYDPYPSTDSAFRTKASTNLTAADQFNKLAIAYLRGKGCPI